MFFNVQAHNERIAVFKDTTFFSLTINQLVSNFKYHFTLGRFGQILGHFLSIQIDCKGTKNI